MKTETRTVSREFESANVLKLTLSHNGYCGGDEGHGGFVKIILENEGGTSMHVNGQRSDKLQLEFRGDTERDTLIQALSMVLCELLLHQSLVNEKTQ